MDRIKLLKIHRDFWNKCCGGYDQWHKDERQKVHNETNSDICNFLDDCLYQSDWIPEDDTAVEFELHRKRLRKRFELLTSQTSFSTLGNPR